MRIPIDRRTIFYHSAREDTSEKEVSKTERSVQPADTE